LSASYWLHAINKTSGLVTPTSIFQEDTGSITLAKQKALVPVPALVHVFLEKHVQGKSQIVSNTLYFRET
jgi:hypothetical protein